MNRFVSSLVWSSLCVPIVSVGILLRKLGKIMLTKGKFIRVSLDLEKSEYNRLTRFTNSTKPRWTKADFIREAVREKLDQYEARVK